jgi:hypothetical protein
MTPGLRSDHDRGGKSRDRTIANGKMVGHSLADMRLRLNASQ